ncbi:MAG: cytochrome c553, partial [Bermanella sp.]
VSGLAVYRGGQFPKEYWQDVFVPEPGANAVVQLRASLDDFSVKAEHITYPDKRWGQREFFASTDERFRPVDLKVGPDGALYVIDMYRGIIQHKDFLTEELRAQIAERGLDKPLGQGRIWRIVSKQSERLKAPNLASATTSELFGYLGSSTAWVRETAQRLLISQPDSSDGLRQVVAEGDTLAAVHALWALEGQGMLDRATLVAALSRDNTAIARQALLAAKAQLDKDTLLSVSDVLLQDTATSLAWLDGLQHINRDVDVQGRLLGQFAANGNNVYLREAAVRGSRGVELVMLEALLNSETLAQAMGGAEILRDLTASAYHSEFNQPERAAQTIPKLLESIAALEGESLWQQTAMLAGLAKAAKMHEAPLMLSEAPAIFEDKSLTGDDPLWLARIAAHKGISWPGDELASGRTPLTGAQSALVEKGKVIYQHCASCHGDKGQGVPGLAPELAGSEWVTGPTEWLARIVLDGMQGEIEVNGKVWNGVMPGHRQYPGLDAESLTGLLIHLRRLGSNRASASSVAQVSEIVTLKPRKSPWTAAEIREVPYASRLDKFAGKYKISFVTFTFTVEGDALAVKAPMYGSSTLNQIDETRFTAQQGGEALEFRFELKNNGEVDALYIVRGGAENRVEKVQ